MPKIKAISWVLGSLVLGALAGWTGCAAPHTDAGDPGDRDISGRFYACSAGAGEELSEPASPRRLPVVRNGEERTAIILEAPAAVRASLEGIAGSVTLDFLAAPVFNLGDGIQMDVLLDGAGPAEKVHSRYFDPGRRSEDRAWIPLSIPLNLSGSSAARLEIRISAGPQGDLVADWLALSSIRIITRGPSG